MKTADLQTLASQIPSLDVEQIKHLSEALATQNGKKLSAYILSKDVPTQCPHCKHPDFHKHGKRNDIRRYRCKSCRKTFNGLTKTPLARLRKKGRWIKFAEALIAGQTVREAAAHCGIDKNTSFRWRHRFLQSLAKIEPAVLTGIIELSETYFKYSEKGAKKPDTPVQDSVVVPSQSDTKPKQVCVVFARDRHGQTADKILFDLNPRSLTDNILPKIAKDALLCSSDASAYTGFTTEHKLKHGKLRFSEGMRTLKNIVHLKNVQAYHLQLENWMRRFRGVATKYLYNYLGWFRNLDEFNMDLFPKTLLRRAKSPQPYHRQPLTSTNLEENHPNPS